MTAQIVDGTPYTPELADKRRLDRNDGAQRLIRVLVRRGLDLDRLPVAALLVLELERQAREAP